MPLFSLKATTWLDPRYHALGRNRITLGLLGFVVTPISQVPPVPRCYPALSPDAPNFCNIVTLVFHALKIHALIVLISIVAIAFSDLYKFVMATAQLQHFSDTIEVGQSLAKRSLPPGRVRASTACKPCRLRRSKVCLWSLYTVV